MTKNSLAAVLLACCATFATSSARAAIVNGGFETGDLSGWTVSGDTGFVGVANGVGRNDSFGAFFGPDPSATLSQTVATTPGLTYAVRFWLALDDSARPNTFSWAWNGVTQASQIDALAHDFVETYRLITATTASSTLSFTFSNPQSFFRLDDVSLAVPEPGALGLVAAALMVAGFAAKRRRAA
jgi:hypothetical protein